MYSVTLSVDADIIEAIDHAARDAPKLMQTAYERATRRLRSQLRDELAEQPGKPRYPLRWKSDRQRRYVMAMLRRENNLPYRRTGRLGKGWKVTIIGQGSGGLLQIENEVPYARFVQGDDAQPFHLDTGWPQAAELVVKYRDLAEERLIQTFFTIVDPFAGVPRE